MNQTSILQWQLPLIKTQWAQSNLRLSRIMVGNSSRLRWLQNRRYKRRRMLQLGREKKNWRWQLMEQNRTMLKPNSQRLTMRSILWLQPTKSIQINHRCLTRNRSSCQPSQKFQQTQVQQTHKHWPICTASASLKVVLILLRGNDMIQINQCRGTISITRIKWLQQICKGQCSLWVFRTST